MNKQELIGKYEYLNHDCFRRVDTSKVLRDLKQLDEPHKVVVPQFVADWIKECKKKGDLSLGGAIQLACPEIYEWIRDWDNQETFARAWLDGYEVEKEKRYTVKMKGLAGDGLYLKMNKKGCWWFGKVFGGTNQYHTRKELEDANFGWVFDCEGIEIEEVTE